MIPSAHLWNIIAPMRLRIWIARVVAGISVHSGHRRIAPVVVVLPSTAVSELVLGRVMADVRTVASIRRCHGVIISCAPVLINAAGMDLTALLKKALVITACVLILLIVVIAVVIRNVLRKRRTKRMAEKKQEEGSLGGE